MKQDQLRKQSLFDSGVRVVDLCSACHTSVAIDTLKRSGQLFKRTWGENLLAQFGLGLVTMLALFAGIIPAALIAAAVSPVIGIALGVLWVATVIVVSTSLTAVYQTALYEYATTGAVPSTFDQVGFETAFSPK